jgi:hypothetical protein
MKANGCKMILKARVFMKDILLKGNILENGRKE